MSEVSQQRRRNIIRHPLYEGSKTNKIRLTHLESELMVAEGYGEG